MFEIAWDNHEEGRNVRQSHMNSLPRFPPRLIDRGAPSVTPLTYPSRAIQTLHWGPFIIQGVGGRGLGLRRQLLLDHGGRKFVILLGLL